MKMIKAILSIIITLLIVASCSKRNSGEEVGEEYTVFGTVSQDSTLSGTDLKVFIDKHGRFVEEDLPLLKGKFVYKGKTAGTDEVYIVDAKGRTVSLYVSGGVEVELCIDTLHKATFIGTDTLNVILDSLSCAFDSLNMPRRRELLKAVCTDYNNTLIPALLIRDKIHVFEDSLYLRQCLGGLTEASKPEWLMSNIDDVFKRPGLRLKRNSRLSPLPTFGTEIDSLPFNFRDARPNSAYLYFWAEFSKESVDSLQMLVPMAKYYGLHEYYATWKSKDKTKRPKRIDIMTICLNAKDSASWREHIDGLPGIHILLQEGFSNHAIIGWKVSKVPYNIIIDRFSNVQDSYKWGKDLRDALEKQPNNFSYQIK